MTAPALPAHLAVLYSGGLDSAILVAHLLRQGHRVRPLYIDCRLSWQQVELAWAQRFLAATRGAQLEEMVVLEMPLADLYDGHWSLTGRDTPRCDEPDESVYLPGRNPLLLIKSHLWCHLHGIDQLALGALATNPFPDASGEFFADFAVAMNRAVAGHVEFVRPFGKLTKQQVMELGQDAPLEFSFSCIAPVGQLHCGHCNKCAERQHAFAVAGLTDPTEYSVVVHPPAPSLQPPA